MCAPVTDNNNSDMNIWNKKTNNNSRAVHDDNVDIDGDDSVAADNDNCDFDDDGGDGGDVSHAAAASAAADDGGGGGVDDDDDGGVDDDKENGDCSYSDINGEKGWMYKIGYNTNESRLKYFSKKDVILMI